MDVGSPTTRKDKEMEAIIPNKAVRELEKLTTSPNPSGEVKIGVQEDRIVFDAGDTALVSRLVEGQYPETTSR